MIFGKKNPRETVPEVATRQGRAPDPRGPLVRRLMLFFGRKKANIQRKIWAKVSAQSELRISGNIRNGEREESGNAETERETERQIQSRRGSRPSQAMGAKDQRALLPSREEVNEEEEGGGLSPPRFRWRRSATGGIIITAIFTNNFTAIITNSSPLYAAM